MAIDKADVQAAMKDIQDRPTHYEGLVKQSTALREHLQGYAAIACDAAGIPRVGPAYRRIVQAVAASAQLGWALRENQEE